MDARSRLFRVAVTALAVQTLSVSGPAFAQGDPDADWIARSTAPGVTMATRFDTQSEAADYTFPDGEAFHVSWEQANKASGSGSLRMDILKTDGSGSGSWVRQLSDDGREFGTGDRFYLQFRQYFPQYFATHPFKGTQFGGPFAGGWKQAIISNMRGSNQLFEVVLQNTGHRGLVQGYNRRTDGGYIGWDDAASTPCSGADFIYQNQIDRGGPEVTCLDSRRKRGGLFSYGENTGAPDPETGAFIFYPNEWLTFLVEVTPGTFGGGSQMTDSRVRVWAAREADTAYTLLIDQDVNLGRATDNNNNPFYFDAVWLLPYNTNRVPDPNRLDTYTLYDEVIVSTNFIAAPNSGGVVGQVRPARITDLTVSN